jgi:hypothetical protein
VRRDWPEGTCAGLSPILRPISSTPSMRLIHYLLGPVKPQLGSIKQIRFSDTASPPS